MTFLSHRLVTQIWSPQKWSPPIPNPSGIVIQEFGPPLKEMVPPCSILADHFSQPKQMVPIITLHGGGRGRTESSLMVGMGELVASSGTLILPKISANWKVGIEEVAPVFYAKNLSVKLQPLGLQNSQNHSQKAQNVWGGACPQNPLEKCGLR